MRGTSLATVSSAIILLSAASLIAGSAIPIWEFLSREEKMDRLYGMLSQQAERFCVESSKPDCTKSLLLMVVHNLANADESLLDRLDPYQRNAKEIIWRTLLGSASRHSTKFGYNSESSDVNTLIEESSLKNDYVRLDPEQPGPYLMGPMVSRVYPDGRPVVEDSANVRPRDDDAVEFKYALVPSLAEIEAKLGSRRPSRGMVYRRRIGYH